MTYQRVLASIKVVWRITQQHEEARAVYTNKCSIFYTVQNMSVLEYKIIFSHRAREFKNVTFCMLVTFY